MESKPTVRFQETTICSQRRVSLAKPGDSPISFYLIHKCISSVPRIHNKAISTNKPPIRCERVGYVPTLTHLDLLLGSTLLWGIPLDLAILLRQIKTHKELGGTPITPQTGNINKPPSYFIFTIFNMAIPSRQW